MLCRQEYANFTQKFACCLHSNYRSKSIKYTSTPNVKYQLKCQKHAEEFRYSFNVLVMCPLFSPAITSFCSAFFFFLKPCQESPIFCLSFDSTFLCLQLSRVFNHLSPILYFLFFILLFHFSRILETYYFTSYTFQVLLLPSDPLDERNIMLEGRIFFFFSVHCCN